MSEQRRRRFVDELRPPHPVPALSTSGPYSKTLHRSSRFIELIAQALEPVFDKALRVSRSSEPGTLHESRRKHNGLVHGIYESSRITDRAHQLRQPPGHNLEPGIPRRLTPNRKASSHQTSITTRTRTTRRDISHPRNLRATPTQHQTPPQEMRPTPTAFRGGSRHEYGRPDQRCPPTTNPRSPRVFFRLETPQNQPTCRGSYTSLRRPPSPATWGRARGRVRVRALERAGELWPAFPLVAGGFRPPGPPLPPTPTDRLVSDPARKAHASARFGRLSERSGGDASSPFGGSWVCAVAGLVVRLRWLGVGRRSEAGVSAYGDRLSLPLVDGRPMPTRFARGGRLCRAVVRGSSRTRGGRIVPAHGPIPVGYQIRG